MTVEKTGFDALMHEICVNQGYCGNEHDGMMVFVSDLLPEEGTVTADQFAELVFVAEGDEPKDRSGTKEKFVAAFIRCMGAERVPASSLRYSPTEG